MRHAVVGLLCISGVVLSVAPWPAHAACTGSEIVVAARGGLDELTATWHLSPPCDVVETGVLIGQDSSALTRVGAAIYSFQDSYWLTIAVKETAMYWVGAYAVDEEGNVVVSSQLDIAPVIVVDRDGPHGSHGAPPSYAGTDADFLVQAGNPHFASLRALNNTDQIQLFDGSLTTSRSLGSTHRDEVAAGQGTPLPFGLATDATGLANALTTLDNRYLPPLFPRPGFYAVNCFANRSAGGAVTAGCVAPISSGFTQLNLNISSMEERTEFSGLPPSLRTNRSSAVFFIPAAPPGQQVQGAQLTASVFTQSTPDAAAQPLLNGKAPVSVSLNCRLFSPTSTQGVNCSGTATWDFTQETRALAAAGGGEFTVSPDSMPQFTIIDNLPSGSVQVITVGTVIVGIAANYPWFHLGPTNNALTLTFAAACPQGLALSATPSSVRPPRPGVTGGTVQVKAEVTTCPPGGGSPSAVIVNLRVDDTRPQPATADANGHLHDTRPATARGRLDASSCTITVQADGSGACTVTYRPSEVGGVETVVASANGFPDSEARISVEMPGLAPMPADPVRYVLVGAPENHAGTNDPCRPLPPASRHSPNHSARPEMSAAVLAIADRMRQVTGILIRVNDMSLPMGGLFDVGNSWRPAHVAHRIGRDADIGFSGVSNGACAPYSEALLRSRIRRVTGRDPLRHSDHFHVYAP